MESNSNNNLELQEELKTQDNSEIQKSLDTKVYTKLDVTYSILCIFLGYLFMKFVLPNPIGIFSMLFIAFFSMITIVYLKKNLVTISNSSYVLLGVILLFNSNFIISSNYFIKFLNIIFVISLSIYWLYITVNAKKVFEDSLVFDWFKSTFQVPFSGFSECPQAIIKTFGKTHFSKNLWFIVIGLFFTIPVTFIVANLLLSADLAFKNLYYMIFENIQDEIFVFILQFSFGLLIAFYLFGLLYANVNKKSSTDENYKLAFNQKTKIAEPMILFSALIPIFLLYLLFFFSQATYFLSAFKNMLPVEFSYAEYARQGFFELCGVCIINLFIIIVINLFCKEKENIKSKGLKICTILLSVFTLLLITTALSKMIMYISNYGLTLLRVYTSWFMLLIAIIFVMIMVSQFAKKLPFVKIISIAFIVMFGILNFSNMDGIIANYNITQYQNGNLDELDIDAMYNLSDSAVKYVAPLVNSTNNTIADEAKSYLEQKQLTLESDISHFNFSSYQASKVLKKQ